MTITTTPPSVTDLPTRIAAKISVDPVSGCWIWTGHHNSSSGYGRFRWNGLLVYAHRFTYHRLVDPSLVLCPGLGSDDQLDHLCRNRLCVNPEHLERVTRRENIMRGLRSVLGDYSSPFVGVCWAVGRRRWQAQIVVGGRQRNLGRFRDEIAAAITYDNAAEILHGDRTNERLGLLDGYLDDELAP